MKKILFLFAVSVMVCCGKQEKKHALPRMIAEEKHKIVVVDSKIMLRSEPQFLNANFKGDTAVANTLSERNEAGHGGRKVENFPLDTILPEYALKVFIDTTYAFYAKGYVYERMNWPFKNPWDSRPYDTTGAKSAIKAYFDREKFLKQKYVSSYPVLILNQSPQTAYVSTGSSLNFRMIQEALDADGKWKPIEFQLSDGSVCIPSNWHYALLPKHYLAGAVIKYSGDFKTKIRIKLYSGNHIYYSNEINGTINRSQFDQRFIAQFLKVRGSDERYFEDYKKLMFFDVADFSKLFSSREP